MSLSNPDLENDPTFLYGFKRIDYIFIIPTLVELALKAGHRQPHQHVISDHKVVYTQFIADDLIGIKTIYKSNASYIKLRIGHMDIVHIYIDRLEEIYTKHTILERVDAIYTLIIRANRLHPQDK